MIIIALFLPLLSLLVSYIARYAPSSQKQNQSKIAAKNEASYFLNVTYQLLLNKWFYTGLLKFIKEKESVKAIAFTDSLICGI